MSWITPPPPHPDWTGRTAVVIASGPSLTPEQCDTAVLRTSERTIAVNTAYQVAPGADVYYAGDFLLWKVHHYRMQREVLRNGRTSFWTCDPSAAERFRLHRWKGVNKEGIGEEFIYLNGNSGAQAINLAYLFGARRILLLGFTMREIDGKKHFHGDHEAPLVQKQLFGEWMHKMARVAHDAKRLGVEIINCDPLSAMTCFPVSTIDKEL